MVFDVVRRRSVVHDSLLKFDPTRAYPSRSAGSGRHPFPRVSAPMGPSDSRHAFGPSFGLPCFRPPALNRADGSLRLLGHLLRTCRGPRPRFVPRPHVPSREDLAAVFGLPKAVDTPNFHFSGLTSHGPHVRAPSHRRARCRPASAPSPTCSSPGVATDLHGSFGRTGFAPAR
jgi:hypothetical protein